MEFFEVTVKIISQPIEFEIDEDLVGDQFEIEDSLDTTLDNVSIYPKLEKSDSSFYDIEGIRLEPDTILDFDESAVAKYLNSGLEDDEALAYFEFTGEIILWVQEENIQSAKKYLRKAAETGFYLAEGQSKIPLDRIEFSFDFDQKLETVKLS